MAKPEQWHTQEELNEDLVGSVIDRIEIRPETDEFRVWLKDPETGHQWCLAFFAEDDGTLGYANGVQE